MNDLNRIFAKKFKSFNLQQHHNRRFFSQNFDVCQHRFAFSKKFYIIIENLIEMFDEKIKKKRFISKSNKIFFSNIFFKSIVNYDLFQIHNQSKIVD